MCDVAFIPLYAAPRFSVTNGIYGSLLLSKMSAFCVVPMRVCTPTTFTQKTCRDIGEQLVANGERMMPLELQQQTFFAYAPQYTEVNRSNVDIASSLLTKFCMITRWAIDRHWPHQNCGADAVAARMVMAVEDAVSGGSPFSPQRKMYDATLHTCE